MSDMNDNDHLMSRSTRDAHIEMERERDEALERLGPIDPAGNDRIDELESAIGFLRHDLDVAKRERDETEARRQGQKQATEDMRARLRAALQDRDKVRSQREDAREAVERLRSETHRIAAERDEALEKADSVTDHAVAILSGACDKHADLSFAEFVEAGGDGCAICIKAERDQARAERDALREALLKVDRLFHEANNLPEHERPAPRDLERLKREAWRATREALAGLEEA